METPETIGDKRNPDGTFAVGNSGGPGRPKGSLSIKDLVRQHLEDNPGDLKEYVEHFIKKNRELSWQMLEGRPQQDITSDGKALPTPILNVVPSDDSNEKDTGDAKEDTGSAGGNVSE